MSGVIRIDKMKNENKEKSEAKAKSMTEKLRNGRMGW